MVDQPAHPIAITYWEGDEGKDNPFSKLTYIEWAEGRKFYYAHADETMFNYGERDEDDCDELQDSRGNWEHRGIPDRVRRALAALIFPPIDLSDDARYEVAEYIARCPHCGTKFGVN